MANIGFDFSEFDELIRILEQLGVSGDEITDTVLNSLGDECINAFREHMPPNSDKNHPHARDNVVMTNIRSTKDYKRKYRVIGAGDLDYGGNHIDWSRFRYLFYVENGTYHARAYPFIDAAERAVRAVAIPKMKQALVDEINRRLE